MTKHTLKPADRPIKLVLAEFLADQRKRLKLNTRRRYEAIIELFESSMDSYAYQTLDDNEETLFDDLYNASGPAHREFCEIFGPEKIPANVHEFLNYFMPRKVVCGQDLLRAAGTVTKKLGKWLKDKGYVGDNDAASMTDSGASASKDLPAAAALARMLAAYADETTAPVGELIEGYFQVCAVGDTSLAVEKMIGDATMTVPVPRPAAAACRPGWTISCRIGKAGRKWCLVEVWNVYP